MNLSNHFEQWLYSSQVWEDMYSSSEDEDMSPIRYDDDELEIIRNERLKRVGTGRGTNAEYTHTDRLNSHLYSNLLSSSARARNVHDPNYLVRAFYL